ncbi:hypothetical protein BGZ93_001408 [Podila epicladia]|nr:hypothetical protein BGZ92_001535 [Podila epicladia]KAG0084066.1 hypothetical protein BGZ93_001408 [Podila epicladia]
MHIPSIIVLSSAALALLVQAENASPNAPIAAPALAGPVTASPNLDAKVQAQAPFNTDVKDKKKPAETPPKEEAASDAKANKNKETDPRPVGKGIVVTTTSFSKSNHGGFLANLLGIDADLLNIGVSDGDNSKTMKMDSDGGVKIEVPDDVPLFGDDGYVPRPLPAQPTGQLPCPTLMFIDQMIWDMQGSKGTIEFRPTPTPPPVPVPATSPGPRDATAPAAVPGIEITVEKNASANEGVHTDGARICLSGVCIGKLEDNDDSKPGKKHIHHKKRKLLHKIAKHTPPLSIDGLTGCPIPSAIAQDVKPDDEEKGFVTTKNKKKNHSL